MLHISTNRSGTGISVCAGADGAVLEVSAYWTSRI